MQRHSLMVSRTGKTKKLVEVSSISITIDLLEVFVMILLFLFDETVSNSSSLLHTQLYVDVRGENST